MESLGWTTPEAITLKTPLIRLALTAVALAIPVTSPSAAGEQGRPDKKLKAVVFGGHRMTTTQDVVRVDLKKEMLDENVDQLTIAIENTPPRSMSGVLKIKWEKTQFSVPFTVKK